MTLLQIQKNDNGEPDMTNTQPPRRCRIQRAELISALIFALLVSMSWLPLPGSAVQDPAADELKQKAQHAYIEGRYAEAAAANSEIAEKYPDSEARRYAVQMLGTIYEENLVDLKKAIQWDREFLDQYADYRQATAYRERIAMLEKLSTQEQAFKAYQAIRFANEGDEIMVKKYEELLKEYPDFILKDRVESELGNAYARLDRRKQSYLAFKAIASEGGENKLSASDRATYEDARRYWQMTWTGAWVAWSVVVILWAVVLLMKPWKRLAWASSKRFLILPALWVLGTIASIPLYYSMNTMGYPIVIPISTLFVASGLNLIVLFWLLLLTRGEFWQTRRLAFRLFTPVLTLLMTTAVFYLFVVYHPQGPYITDIFGVKLEYWRGEIREHGLSLTIPGR
jgi:tetratricopeptide (TPR) repeat protein